jgi:hypothetical protein
MIPTGVRAEQMISESGLPDQTASITFVGEDRVAVYHSTYPSQPAVHVRSDDGAKDTGAFLEADIYNINSGTVQIRLKWPRAASASVSLKGLGDGRLVVQRGATVTLLSAESYKRLAEVTVPNSGKDADQMWISVSSDGSWWSAWRPHEGKIYYGTVADLKLTVDMKIDTRYPRVAAGRQKIAMVDAYDNNTPISFFDPVQHTLSEAARHLSTGLDRQPAWEGSTLIVASGENVMRLNISGQVLDECSFSERIRSTWVQSSTQSSVLWASPMWLDWRAHPRSEVYAYDQNMRVIAKLDSVAKEGMDLAISPSGNRIAFLLKDKIAIYELGSEAEGTKSRFTRPHP